jgi:hypothetical protein
MKLSPIIIFTYNRLWHTQRTISALKENALAKESELFIYSDGAKGEGDRRKVEEVRDYIKTINGFYHITIIERYENWGLARNIISGVTEVINNFGRVIVLEDDVIVNPHFLTFMNNALLFYENKKSVWHISTWNYSIRSNNLPETFLWRVMNCSGGWATWADRWNHFERNPEKIFNEFSEEEIYRFNLEGAYDFWSQIQGNLNGKLFTWAIFWYAIIFKNKGLCLNPAQSLVQNIGYDGSGCHSGKSRYKEDMPLNYMPYKFQEELVECEKCVEIIKVYLNKQKPSFPLRIASMIKRWLIK